MQVSFRRGSPAAPPTLGQSVEFVPLSFDGHVPRSAYTVVRQYGHERVVLESQLRSYPSPPPLRLGAAAMQRLLPNATPNPTSEAWRANRITASNGPM